MSARISIITLLLLTLFGDLQAQNDSPYRLIRYNEDWSSLRDSSKLSTLQRLKYIPLGDSSYLSLGGEARQLYESYNNLLWEAVGYDGYLLQRYFFHADLHLGSWGRVFTQLGGAYEDGRVQGPRPIDEDQAFVHQAFVELNPTPRLSARIGRQEISLGSVRLFTVREGPNVRLSHDALRLDYTLTPETSLTGILGRPVLNTPGWFDNPFLTEQETFWGGYAGAGLGGLGTLDLYVLGQASDRRTYTDEEGRERRHSFGIRWYGQSAGWHWDHEVMYQHGGLNDHTISAYTVSLWGGYHFNDAPLSPDVALKSEIISGDTDAGDDRLGTFRTFYAKPAYFGFSSLIGPSNLLDLHPIVTLHPAPGMALALETTVFWRYSTEDALYDINGLIVRPADNRSRYVGSMPILFWSWQASPRIQLIASYNRFLAGDFITDSGGTDFDYVYAFIKYVF